MSNPTPSANSGPRKMSSTTGARVYDIPFSELAATTPETALDTGLYTVPFRFRFLDCEAVVKEKRIRCLEFTTLPRQSYACISYPWDGFKPLPGSPPSPLGEFLVRGTKRADSVDPPVAGPPISLSVLMTACTVALKKKCKLVWIDRLSIIQTNMEDKNWHIKRMGRIYNKCKACLALLGGMQRLPGLLEETSWATRVWTLQEALLPKETWCIFSWAEEEPTVRLSHGEFEIIEEKVSATTSLESLLAWCNSGFRYSTENPPPKEPKITVLTVKIVDKFNQNLTRDALGKFLKNSDSEVKESAIWRCAWARTASYPVDMIFGMMGMFGVEIDPSGFDREDREGATMAFAKALMQKGKRASWIGISLELPPLERTSIFPAFAHLEREGKRVVRILDPVDKVKLMSEVVCLDWVLKDAPQGELDDDGYLTFTSKAVPLEEIDRAMMNNVPGAMQAATAPSRGQNEGKVWKPISNNLPETASRAYAVLVGIQYPVAHGEEPLFQILDNRVLMIVQPHGNGKYYRQYFATTTEETVKHWDEYEFCIGGSAPRA